MPGGMRWPTRNPVPSATPAGVVEVFTATGSAVVRADSTEPVAIDAKADGRPVTEFEVAAVRGDEAPVWRPAVLANGKPSYLTSPAPAGRYRLLARRNGTVLSAGPLIRT